MPKFTDTTGRVWPVSVTVADIKRVKTLTGVNLYALVDDGCKPLAELLADPCAFVDVLFALVKPKSKELGVSDEAFGSALGGDALTAAAEAFVEALFDFFPARQRTSLKTLAEKGNQVGSLLEQKAAAKVERVAAMDPEMIVRFLANPDKAAREKAFADYLANPGSASFTSVPALSVSTPDRSPCAS